MLINEDIRIQHANLQTEAVNRRKQQQTQAQREEERQREEEGRQREEEERLARIMEAETRLNRIYGERPDYSLKSYCDSDFYPSNKNKNGGYNNNNSNSNNNNAIVTSNGLWLKSEKNQTYI
eukprot:Pgem_evm1s13910